MNLLYIDGTIRGEGVSRTKALADSFVKALLKENDALKLKKVVLKEEKPSYLDEATLEKRNALGKTEDFSHPMFDYARDFAAADIVVLSAPYWDLSFPALVKAYLEHIFVNGVTFVYGSQGAEGLCKGKHLVYITTAGGFFGEDNCGGGYLKSCCGMLGIENFHQLSAQGLDIMGVDVAEIMEKAVADGEILAKNL